MKPPTEIVLYTFRRCPYAIRARLALRSSGLPYQAREIELKRKPQHLLTLSPKGTVPVLWIKSPLEECVLDQSLSIMSWCLSQNDPQGWLESINKPGAIAMQLIEQNDGPFKSHLDRYKYPSRFGLISGLEDRDCAAKLLNSLQEQLMQQPFLSGERWGFVDAALAPFVRQYAHTDLTWFLNQPWRELMSWLRDFEQSEDFLAVMHKSPIWCEFSDRAGLQLEEARGHNN
jgi:glutathione S-transferase